MHGFYKLYRVSCFWIEEHNLIEKQMLKQVEVKVKENWRQDEGLLYNYGYGGQIRAL